ncbi:probable positive effector protein gcn20 [Ceraceosorus bombacis]|uniref:Probable positive effector protein gcn20 n=1 Tax=Ceraceosorus bombacis TaxID=401625 RepID=A0A0P1BAS8_9BASI|nr:probable positive effector protein gcn20 [Ceraceosorus bombacis]
MPTRQREIQREELTARLGEVQAKLVDMEADTGPSRAASLLSGLGILDKDQSKPTSSFSGPSSTRSLRTLCICTPRGWTTTRATLPNSTRLEARGERISCATQAQSKIKELERMPEVEAPEQDEVVKFRLPETDKLPPPLLQLDNVTFGYTPDKILLKDVNFDVGMESRIAIVGSNGAGKSTLMKLLMGNINPISGDQKRNNRLRIGYFSQHHIDQLDLTVSPVAFLAAKFPGKSVEEYRSHLGAFGIKGPTGLQIIATLSGGQKSRVAFAQLSLMRPHVLLLDEPTNHLDIEGLDALMDAIKAWNGGVIAISHDQRFIQNCMDQLWVADAEKKTVTQFRGDVESYKSIIIEMNRKLQTSHS